MQNIIYKTQM